MWVAFFFYVFMNKDERWHGRISGGGGTEGMMAWKELWHGGASEVPVQLKARWR